MKIKQNSTYQSSTRWLGLALACGTLTFAVSTQAAKPPPTPSSPAYVPVLLGGLRSSEGGISTSVSDLNNAGQVVGNTCVPGYPSTEYGQAFLLNPQDVNGDGKLEWFVDKDADGQNDLMIGLGNLPGSRWSQASAVNDLGLVVGTSSYNDPLTGESRTEVFIVVPDGPDWYQDSNGDGFNDLISQLGSLPGKGESGMPNDINNLGQIVGWCVNGVYQYTGFLLTPEVDVYGVWQWYQDDGSGANALMHDLGAFIPRGINDSGQIVGNSGRRPTGGRAMLRNPDGSLIDLGAAGTESEAVAINNGGQIALSVHLTSDPANDWRARLLTPVDTNNDGKPDLWYRDLNHDGVNDLIVDLGTAQKLRSSGIAAHGLNDAGSVAGASWTIVNPPRFSPADKRVPYLWQNGVLQTLTEVTGVSVQWNSVSAINNAGQIVCIGFSGTSTFYGNGNAYILLPTR